MNQPALLVILSLSITGTLFPAERSATMMGRFGTYLYSLEKIQPDATTDQRVMSYESIDLSAYDVGTAGLSFHTYLRTLNNPDGGEPEGPMTKIYTAYLQYDRPEWLESLRVGRQFLHSGVGRGKMDGIRADLSPATAIFVTGYIGAQEPDLLSTKIDSWSSSHTWGGRVRVDRIPETQVGWSYNRRSRDGGSEAEFMGIDVRNRTLPGLDLYGKFDYDRIAKHTGYLVVRADSRIGSRFSLSAEFARDNPQIRSNSILSVFRQERYDQVRIRPYFRLTERLGLEGEYAIVDYLEDTTHRLNGGVSFGMGSAGFIYRSGYGGKTGGGYGSLYLDPVEDLLLRIYANYQKYRTVEETSPLLETFVTSATFDYSRFDPLNLSLELQEAWDPLLKSDFRFFARVNYRFRVRE